MKKLSSRSTLVLGILQAITIYSYCLYLSEASDIINAPVFSKREQPKGTNFSVLAKNTKWFSTQFSRVLMPKEEEDDDGDDDEVVEEEEEEDKNDDDEDDEIETESPTLSPTHEPSHSSETPTESVLSEMIQATSSSSSVSPSKNEELIQQMQKKPLNGDLPLDEFSMKLYFSVSSLTSDINYNDFEEVMSWYLEEYFSAHWESVLVEPIISSGLSSQLELDDGSVSLVKKYFDALESFSIEYVDLDLTSFSTSRETTRNRRGLRNNSAQGRKLPVNKVVTTSFDGKVIVKSKKLDELEDEEDAEKYKEDRALLENVLLILEEQVIHLQKKAFSEAEEIPIATYIRVETGGSNEILTDVESVKVSFPGDEIIDEESNNENNNGENGEGLPATGINAGSSSNSSEEESKKDVIVRIVTALLTGIGGALIVAIMYAFIKRRKRKNPKTRNDGTADLTDDMRSTINLKHKIRNNNDDDFDDLSSIGMGTAIFTSPKSVITAYTNIHQDRNNNNDDMSQVSFGYSVDGHSLATKQMPKYAKPDDDDDDDDDDSYSLDSNPVRNAVKAKAKEAREQQQQQQKNRRTLNQSNNNSKARNSRSLSRASARTRDDSVWTFSHMGMGNEDSILEEGFEICETNNHNNSDLASSLDEMLLEGSVGGATNATGSTLNGLSTHYSLNRGRSFGDRSIVSNITCDDEDQHHINHINLQQHQKKHLVLPDIRNDVSQDSVAHKNHSTTTTSKTTTRINAASQQQQQQQPKPAAEINSFSYLSAPKALVKTISALSTEPGQIVTGRKQQSQWSLSNFMSETTNNNMGGRRCDDTLSDAPSDEFTIQSPAKLSNNDHLVDEDQWNTYDQPADNDANIGISRVDSRFDQDSILEDLAVLDRSLTGKKKKAGASFKRRFG